jgi:hypothetical protein
MVGTHNTQRCKLHFKIASSETISASPPKFRSDVTLLPKHALKTPPNLLSEAAVIPGYSRRSARDLLDFIHDRFHERRLRTT